MTARVIEDAGTVEWDNDVDLDLDLDPDVLYEKSEKFRQTATAEQTKTVG